MTVQFRTLVSIAAAAGLLAVPPAQAQTPAASLVKPPAVSKTSKTSPAGRWTCASRAMVELAPISYDTYGEPTAWVRVYRVKGEIVAAEHVDPKEVEQIRRLPCGGPDSEDGGAALLG